MINIIFSFTDVRDALSDEQKDFFNSQFDFVAGLSKTRKVNNKIVYQGNVSSYKNIAQTIQLLNTLWETSIIWVWQYNWLQYGYKYHTDNTDPENPIITIVRDTYIDEEWIECDVEILYPFNLSEYINYLKDIVTYDNERNEISRERPTVAIQLNKFDWMEDRNLNIID